MGEEITILEQRQQELKNDIKTLKNRIPYIIFGLAIFILGFIYLFEEKVNVYFGNSINLLYFSGATFIILLVFFWVNTKKRIKRKQLEIKVIKSKVYKLMRLNA